MNDVEMGTNSAAAAGSSNPDARQQGLQLVKGFKSDTPSVPGRRAFFTYRDLGASAGSNGRMRANKVTSIEKMVEPTGWHYHVCEMQFVYWLKGTAVLEFEDGTVGTFREGDSLFMPGGVRHNEIYLSDDQEVLEVVVPGEIGTVPCDRPEGLPLNLKPIASNGDGQQTRPGTDAQHIDKVVRSGMTFVTGFASDTPYVSGRRSFFKYRDLGAKSASNGKMRATSMTAIAEMLEPTGWHSHSCEMQFVYYLKGEVVLEFEDGTVGTFRAGDSVFIPGGVRHNEIHISHDNEALEVVLPGEMGTVACERPEGLSLTLKPVASKE